jgi:hypothetical protein
MSNLENKLLCLCLNLTPPFVDLKERRGGQSMVIGICMVSDLLVGFEILKLEVMQVSRWNESF